MPNCTIILNNDDKRFQDPILLLKFRMGTRKNFAENYRQFAHALSESLASPGLDSGHCNSRTVAYVCTFHQR
jgi:hypothetical protein